MSVRSPEEHMAAILDECCDVLIRCTKDPRLEVRGAARIVSAMNSHYRLRPFPGADVLFGYLKAELESIEAGEDWSAWDLPEPLVKPAAPDDTGG